MKPDKDPALMTDEELDKALNPDDEVQDEEEEVSDEEDDSANDDADDSKDEEEESKDEDEDEEEEEEKPVSRRQQLRIDTLLEKLKEKDADKAPSKSPLPDKALNYKDELDADDETFKKLEDDRKQYGEELYRRGVDQAKSIQWETRLELDAPKVHAKFTQLDKDSSDFNPTLANTVNSMYLNMVGFDSNTGLVQNDKVRYSDFVESMFELSDEMGRKKVEESRKNITKQASKTGIRPDGSSVKKRLNLDKAPEAMTDEELDAIIGMAIPKK